MLKSEIVKRVIELHGKSYQLLKWVNNSLIHGDLKFDVIHDTMGISDASLEWIRRYYDNIPPDARPPMEYIDEFACLFASYLTTSFELVSVHKIRKSYCGCYCQVCSYLISAEYLMPRKLSKKARKNAFELKRIFLSSLADNLKLALLENEIDQLLRDKELREKIALLTYCNELIRRTQFASQGEGVLFLWREIAWQGTAPKKGFSLKTEDIMNAQNAIIVKMNEFL